MEGIMLLAGDERVEHEAAHERTLGYESLTIRRTPHLQR